MKFKIKFKYLIFFYVFLLLFLFNSGIIYLVYNNSSLQIIIDSFLASSLVMCFSFGFILIDIGLKSEVHMEKNLIIRYLGIILIMLSFGSFMLIMIKL